LSPESKPDDFQAIKEKYDEIYVILSPPRCSSTAFARVFWEQPSIRFYAHEPFEGTYFLGHDLDNVLENLSHSLDLREIKSYNFTGHGNSLVIKEMPYQVGEYLPHLLSLTKKPVVFLTRDPRQSIASRMAKKQEVGDDPLFPHIETGWQLLDNQIKYCREQAIPYLIVDAKDFRNHPVVIFRQLFKRLGLPFREAMLRWDSRPDVDIDNLGGYHDHLYQDVLSSRGMYPDTETIPSLQSFPVEKGYREHVKRCLQIYQGLQGSPARIKVPVNPGYRYQGDGAYTGSS
jgi:hypothetical protein